jgi:hypothetical protein
MPWKSNEGLKVLEQPANPSQPLEPIKFISSPLVNADEQISIPSPTVYVTVEFIHEDELNSANMEKLQETGGAFDFLKDKEEISYKSTDGDLV